MLMMILAGFLAGLCGLNYSDRGYRTMLLAACITGAIFGGLMGAAPGLADALTGQIASGLACAGCQILRGGLIGGAMSTLVAACFGPATMRLNKRTTGKPSDKGKPEKR